MKILDLGCGPKQKKPGATARVITPHYSSQLSYGDLEHFYHFGYVTFCTLENTGLFKT